MKAISNDFPDWAGPMLVKELRQSMRSRSFSLSFSALQAALVLLLVSNVLRYSRNPERFDPTKLSSIFWMLIAAHLLVLTPLRAVNEFAGERKARTLELIYLSGLSAWRICFGKWV